MPVYLLFCPDGLPSISNVQTGPFWLAHPTMRNTPGGKQEYKNSIGAKKDAGNKPHKVVSPHLLRDPIREHVSSQSFGSCCLLRKLCTSSVLDVCEYNWLFAGIAAQWTVANGQPPKSM